MRQTAWPPGQCLTIDPEATFLHQALPSLSARPERELATDTLLGPRVLLGPSLQ